jgi:hypothetical protein
MRVCIVGNSVGFKMRPPRSGPGELTYGEILRQGGHEVTNASMAGVFLTEQFALLDDQVLTAFPDVVILHHGVIEVFYRRTFRRWNNSAIVNQYRNQVMRQEFVPRTPAFVARNFFFRAVNAATRGVATAVGWRWQWQSADRFLGGVTHACELVLKETGAFIVIVGISPPSDKAETDLPGLRAEIGRRNEALRKCAERLGPRVEFLDVAALLAQGSYADLVPDGIHFSAEGHRRVAAALSRILEARAAR